MRRSDRRLFIAGLVLVIIIRARQASALRVGDDGGIVDLAAPASVSFLLDGVGLELSSSFFSEWNMVASDPTSAIQMATAVQRGVHFRQLSVTAVPFGTMPPTESLPRAGPGRAPSYRSALWAFREEQGGSPKGGPNAFLFGQDILGMMSVTTLPVRGEPIPVVIGEWIVEAGPRLWIVRAGQELELDEDRSLAASGVTTSLSDLSLASPEVNEPSTSLRAARTPVGSDPQTHESAGAPAVLPQPHWWDGDCDTNNFEYWTGAAAYPLGGEYRGVKACGPRPWADGGPSRWVNFGEGATQIEWQCPELTKRFLYLAYGIPPYSAHGSQVVENYEGDLLEKVYNCTVGRAPGPGDVMSYGPLSSYGHTSLVKLSEVDVNGDGSITIIEQNSSTSGQNTYLVVDWCVQSSYGEVSWLHLPDWQVTYYGDESLGSVCAVGTDSETYLFHDWGDAGPAHGCPAESFSARFSRSLEFPGGEYTFALGYEHGAQLKIDGSPIIDGWSGPGEHYATVDLTAGDHRIDVEVRHGAGSAALSAFWWGPGFELSRDAQEASRWYGEYWPNQTLWWDPAVTVQGGDGMLDHQWTNGPPTAGLPVDHFSTRFRRTISLGAGQWQFDVSSDDGVRFWVDDVLILDEWQDQVAVFTPTVNVKSGAHELRVEHYENLEWAKVGVSWAQVSGEPTPAGWITTPMSGTVVETCPITVEVDVDPGLGPVDRVEFYAYYHGAWHHLGDDHDGPFTQVWDCEAVADRTANLLVHVWDDTGREIVDPSGVVRVKLAHRELLHLPLIVKARDARP